MKYAEFSKTRQRSLLNSINIANGINRGNDGVLKEIDKRNLNYNFNFQFNSKNKKRQICKIDSITSTDLSNKCNSSQMGICNASNTNNLINSINNRGSKCSIECAASATSSIDSCNNFITDDNLNQRNSTNQIYNGSLKCPINDINFTFKNSNGYNNNKGDIIEKGKNSIVNNNLNSNLYSNSVNNVFNNINMNKNSINSDNNNFKMNKDSLTTISNNITSLDSIISIQDSEANQSIISMEADNNPKKKFNSLDRNNYFLNNNNNSNNENKNTINNRMEPFNDKININGFSNNNNINNILNKNHHCLSILILLLNLKNKFAASFQI